VGLLGVLKFDKQQNRIYEVGSGFLRIRYEGGKTYLTHKGERQQGTYNSREETELEVSDAGQLESIFGALGMSDSFCYEKERANFVLNGCVVCIDKLPNGENYLEIEGAEEDIEKNLDYFGLLDRKIEERSYQEILGG